MQPWVSYLFRAIMESYPNYDNQRRTVSLVAKAVAGLLIVILVPMEILLQNNFEYYGGKAIDYIQSHFGTDSAHTFFHGLNYMGNNLTLLLTTVILYQTCEPMRGIKFCIVTCTGMYLATLFNLIFAEPRPYWVYGHISAGFCERSFATPSFVIVLIHISAGYLIFEYPIIKALKLALSLVSGATMGLIYYGSLYMGVLFPHQIVISLVFSYVYITSCLMMDATIKKIVLRSCYNYRKNRVNIINWILATLVLLLTAITVFDELTLGYNIEIEWIKHATAECEFAFNVGTSYSFFNSSYIFFQLGIVIGSMLTHRHYHESWWRTEHYKRFIRASIAVGMVLGLYFMFNLIPNEDTTTEYTFKYAIPYFLSGGLVTLPLTFLGSYIKLVNRQ